jgi:prepilin signal peptidase PulO-like enzyme (type II secretory pathway)
LDRVTLVRQLTSSVDLPLFLLFAVPITLTDIREYRIPDALSLGGIAAFVVLRLLAWTGAGTLWEPLVSCVLGFGSFFLIRLATGGKLGLGDAKLSALVAVAAGAQGWLAAVFIASVSGLLCAAVMVGALGFDRKARIAFAPFLCLGGALAIALRGLIAGLGWGGA